MASSKGQTPFGGIQYQVSNPANVGVKVAAVVGAATPSIRFIEGGNTVTLSQQNVTDLLSALTTFSSSGVWS